MAVIGCPYTVIITNPQSASPTVYQVKGVSNISATINYRQLSRLNKYYKVPESATVAINIVNSTTYSNIFHNYSKAPVTLRWVTKETTDYGYRWIVHEIENVVLSAPSLSAVTKQQSITYTTFDITGQSYSCPKGMRTTSENGLSSATQKANEGWTD